MYTFLIFMSKKYSERPRVNFGQTLGDFFKILPFLGLLIYNRNEMPRFFQYVII